MNQNLHRGFEGQGRSFSKHHLFVERIKVQSYMYFMKFDEKIIISFSKLTIVVETNN